MIAFLEDLKAEGFDEFWYVSESEPDFSAIEFFQVYSVKNSKTNGKKNLQVLIFYAAFIKILIGSYELNHQC